jgi:hypothetical protein
MKLLIFVLWISITLFILYEVFVRFEPFTAEGCFSSGHTWEYITSIGDKIIILSGLIFGMLALVFRKIIK